MLSRQRDVTARSRHLCLATACVITASVAFADATPPSLAQVEQPRPFGHFIGDRLHQRVLLEVQGKALEPAAMPAPERLGVWIERLSTRIETDLTKRRWLAVEYQIVNAAPSLATVRLPAWQLKGTLAKTGDAAMLNVDAWPIQVAALTPSTAEVAVALRPDRPAPPIAIAPIEQRLQVSLGMLLLTLLSWLGWILWRNRRAAAQQPFARALRELRGLGPSDPGAWHALHRAFEHSAGRALQRSSVHALFRAAPHLIALRAEIEDFFARSEAFFFAAGKPPGAIDLHILCRKLRRLESRHER
jgi:mxaA protein